MTVRHHMLHPGPIHRKRIIWARSDAQRIDQRIGFQGQSLEQAIATLVATTNATSGNGILHHTALSKTRFTTGGPARDGKAANYTFIRERGAANLPQGTFTFGLDGDGSCFVHCHAVIKNSESDAEIAGHLFPKDCLLEAPFDVSMICLPDITLRQNPDAETLHSVFDLQVCAQSAGQALFVRIRPNEDITRAVEAACAEAGFTDATIMPSIGSLNAPLLDSGQCKSVGMEVIALTGTVKSGAATLNARLCDETGALHQGQLIRDGASICVTAELVICAVDQALPDATE